MVKKQNILPENLLNALKHEELCIVLGLGTQTGLSVLRCLGRQGISVLGLDQKPFPMGKFSRYCNYFIHYKTNSHLLSIFKDIAAELSRKIPIIVSNDRLAMIIDEYQVFLSGQFLFNWQTDRKLRDVISKNIMIRLAEEAGIDIPLTWSSDISPIKNIRKEIVFPSIMKPFFTMSTKKGFIIRSLRDFEDALNLDMFREGFIVQELIEGPETNIVNIETYSNKRGCLIATSCGRKIRQLPRDMGIATYLQSYDDEEVIRLAEIFINHTGYFGIADIEFKKSIIDGRYKFIEINPRFSSLNEFAMAQGVNLPHLYYQDLLGKLDIQSHKIEKRADITWISILDDLHTFFRFYFPQDPKAIISWVKDIIQADVDGIFSVDDIIPFGVALAEYIIRPFVNRTSR